MGTLIAGMCIFFGVHLVPLTGLKPVLQERLGANAYKGVFSLLAIVGLGLMIWGFGMARSGPQAALILYDPPHWGFHAVPMLMLPALIILASQKSKSHINLWVKHPMSTGVAVWAVGHLFANGNYSEVLFFGGFLAYALLDIVVNLAKGNVPDFQPRWSHDIRSVVIGVGLYFLFVWLHPIIIGVSVV